VDDEPILQKSLNEVKPVLARSPRDNGKRPLTFELAHVSFVSSPGGLYHTEMPAHLRVV